MYSRGLPNTVHAKTAIKTSLSAECVLTAADLVWLATVRCFRSWFRCVFQEFTHDVMCEALQHSEGDGFSFAKLARASLGYCFIC
jgi:hypothetical protein